MFEKISIFVVIALMICCTINYFKNRKLSTNVYIDELTGLYNRKIMKQVKSNELSSIRYYIIACDIDHFKAVNDTYGHIAGDLVLKTVAETIKTTFKSNVDYVVRFGGEEFFVFMKESEETKNIILERAEAVRSRVEALNILTENMKLIKVTSSFGVCLDTSLSLDKRIEASDANLYKAKESGRNKVVS